MGLCPWFLVLFLILIPTTWQFREAKVFFPDIIHADKRYFPLPLAFYIFPKHLPINYILMSIAYSISVPKFATDDRVFILNLLILSSKCYY